MRLTVNGKEYFTEENALSHLLKELDIVPERVAVEVNLRVIKREDLGHYQLNDGDDVEIVYFVGGGQENRQQGIYGTQDVTQEE